jgi:hypothetical protein
VLFVKGIGVVVSRNTVSSLLYLQELDVLQKLLFVVFVSLKATTENKQTNQIMPSFLYCCLGIID